MVPPFRRNDLCPCTSSSTHLRHASHPQSRSTTSFNAGHNSSSRPVTTTKWCLAVGWVCLAILISTLWLPVPTHALPTTSNNHGPPPPLLIPLRRLIPNHQASSTAFKKTKRSSSSPAGTTPISVTTVGRVGYAGHILIGSPPQRLSVLFDTGSDLALVISDHCQGLECPELTHFSCSKSASCVDLGGGGVGVSARPTIVVETELATTDSSPPPPTNSEAEVPGGDVTPLPHVVSSTVQEHEHERNGGAGVRAETSRSTSHGGQEQWQQVQSKTQHHQQQRRDVMGHGNGDPSTLLDRLRSSKTLPPSQPQPPAADVNEGMTTSDGNPPMVAARLIGPGANKIEDGLQLLHQDTPNPAFSVEKVHSAAASIAAPVPPPPTSPISSFYNQTYVDGSWGAGTFVQDRIQVDTTPPGEVFNSYHHMNDDGSFESSSTGHVATVTFLDVVQDNLGLVKGYDGQISGLLGLTRASPTGRKTFLRELVDQGSLAQPVVSMHLGAEGGSFLLGGIDPSQYSGQLVYSPVTDPVTWQMSLQGLGIRYRDGHYSAVSQPSAPIINSAGTFNPSRPSDTNPTSTNGKYKVLPQLNVFQDAPLILDSGTSSILIPTDASQAIHSELSGTWDPVHQAWFLPCQGPDLIWWVSSGQHGIIQPYESLIYPLEDGRCQSLIFENPDANYWILGDTWLRGLYVVYDMEGTGRIGIATAKSLNATGIVGSSGEARILTVEDSSPARRLRPSLWGVVSGSASGVGLVLMVAVHALVGALV
ncbi:acid protease [Linnemannia elongata AG-77]|uniref:Acid protease n=1 Tax=Linnemannia elongata AG-77 TaxID=1314771 RepID=A0A197KEI2_9FUNG|nr:acid protease [Linnemannia elongata AG-77]